MTYSLEEYKELLEQILENMDGVVATDVNNRIIYLNKTYAEILGVNISEAIGKNVEDIIPHTRMHIVNETGKIEKGSVFVMKNGNTVIVNRLPIMKNGKKIGVVAFSTFTRLDEISSFIEKINRLNVELSQYKTELRDLRASKYSIDQIVGETALIHKMREYIKNIAQTRSTVLITGETGTGKELIAHAIHQQSPRSYKPFVRINCAAIPKDLLEAELFGYEEGAFTGAKKGGKIGKFEVANGGTLLLDEIDQLPLNMQSKLLRVIQEREIDKVGGLKVVEVDVRLICISNQNILELVNKGEFRKDLYYRINVIEINSPPLRERIDDIPILVEHIVKKINRDLGISISNVNKDVLKILSLYHWPGNIRELEHVLERASNIALVGELGLEHFEFFSQRIAYNSLTNDKDINTLENAKNKAEKEAIISALMKTKGNKKNAAEILEIDRTVLYDKLKKYNISF